MGFYLKKPLDLDHLALNFGKKRHRHQHGSARPSRWIVITPRRVYTSARRQARGSGSFLRVPGCIKSAEKSPSASEKTPERFDMALKMTTCSFADTTLVECSGRIVLGDESANFRHLVEDLLTECKQIVLDLGEVTYIDSTGLGVLVGLLNSAQKAGGNIKLAQLKPRLIDVLGVTKLMTLFQTFDRAEDAVNSFNPGTGDLKIG
jgi:anti-sigma B factor antagonist